MTRDAAGASSKTAGGRLILLVACAVLSACGAPDAPAEVQLSRLPSEAGPLDALNRRHGRLRERMRRRGYGTHVALTRAFVLEVRGVAFPLDLEVGRCSSFVALGGGSIRDTSLTLYDGEGAEAATESVAGEGGLIHVCPQGADGSRPYFLMVRANEGAGAVMVAQFSSAPETGEGFDGLFEGVLAPRVPFRDVEEHLARSRTALRARGFAPLSVSVLEHVVEGAAARLPVQLEAGRCYVVVGRSGEGLDDIDLFLFDGAGVEVARDLGADAEPSIEHCPETSARFLVELRAFSGAGAAGALVFEGAERAPEDAEPVEAGVESAPADPAVALDVLAAPLVRRGFAAPLFVSRDAAIVPGEVRTHEVVVGPGCALIAGTASHEGIDLDLYLAEQGRDVDRDTAVQSTARVRACRPAPTVLRVAVKGYGRDGAYALALLRAPDEVATLQALRLEESTAPYRMRDYGDRLNARAELDEGGILRRPLVVEAGTCVAVGAAGDDGALDVDLTLRDSAEEPLVTDNAASPHAIVTRCADVREVVSVEVTMSRGSGSVAVQVLATATPVTALPPEAPSPDQPSPDAPPNAAPAAPAPGEPAISPRLRAPPTAAPRRPASATGAPAEQEAASAEGSTLNSEPPNR